MTVAKRAWRKAPLRKESVGPRPKRVRRLWHKRDRQMWKQEVART